MLPITDITTRRVESDLGCWTFSEWRPAPGSPLAWAVRRVWDFEGIASMPRERVFPDGAVELLLQLEDRYRDVHASGDSALTPAVCVTGIHTGAFVVEAPSRPVRVIGVRLHPPAAWALLRHPLSELVDLTADLEDLVGRAATELAERCHAIPTGAERVRRVVGWLEARLLGAGATGMGTGADVGTGAGARTAMRAAAGTPAGAAAVDASVCHVAGAIVRTGGRSPIGPLGREAGLTPARLADLFRRQVGVTPKHFARIQRFQGALSLLNRAALSLSEVALAAGYYDQPHMNAEFRDLAGLTPGEFVAARRFPGSVSLAESA